MARVQCKRDQSELCKLLHLIPKRRKVITLVDDERRHSILPGSAGKHGKRHIKREAGEPIPRVTSDNRTIRNLDERVRDGIELRALNCPPTTGEPVNAMGTAFVPLACGDDSGNRAGLDG